MIGRITTEEFWKIYMNRDNILTKFDITYDFFNGELPKEFEKNYDVGEVILETRGHHETAKEFEKVLMFTDLIQRIHPKLYAEFFQYFDDFLVDYHCFHQNQEEAEKAFSNFYTKPLQSFDKLLLVLKKLLFYQHVDIVDKTIAHIFNKVKKSTKLIDGAEFDLSMYKYYINLEFFYKNTDINKGFDQTKFIKSVEKYDFVLKDEFLHSIIKGFFDPIVIDSESIHQFTHNHRNFLLTLQNQFFLYMAERKFRFVLSGILWDSMLMFWEEQSENKKQKPDKYFTPNIDILDKYLASLTGDFFTHDISEMIAVLWGSAYIYDFLLSIGLIDQATHNAYKKTSNVLKGKVIAQFTCDLWNSEFVHHWVKPDSIAEDEFIEEGKLFRKSISFKPQPFADIRAYITDELSKIGELADYILTGAETLKDKSGSKFGNLFNLFGGETLPKEDSPDNLLFDNFRETAPYVAPPKIGRNDPCVCGSGKKYKKCCENK